MGSSAPGRTAGTTDRPASRDTRHPGTGSPPADSAQGARNNASTWRCQESSTCGYVGFADRGEPKNHQANSSMARQAGRPLPRPSKRSSSDSAAIAGPDRDRWANPAPLGRSRTGKGNPGSCCQRSKSDENACFGCCAGGASGGGARGPVLVGRTQGINLPTQGINLPTAEPYVAPTPHEPQTLHPGLRSRGSWAPRYRSGSPAPTRGRRSEPGLRQADPPAVVSRPPTHRKARIPPGHSHGSKRPAESRSHASLGLGGAGGGWGSGPRGDESDGGLFGPSYRCHPPSTAARDRPRRGRESVLREDLEKAPIMVLRQDFRGQRPATSEGSRNGGGVAGRGTSSSPAPRPTSGSDWTRPTPSGSSCLAITAPAPPPTCPKQYREHRVHEPWTIDDRDGRRNRPSQWIPSSAVSTKERADARSSLIPSLGRRAADNRCFFFHPHLCAGNVEILESTSGG